MFDGFSTVICFGKLIDLCVPKTTETLRKGSFSLNTHYEP